jgi:hypothetical protein
MSDGHTTDDANLSELTDDDKLSAEYPPEEPLGVDEYGTTAREQAVPEPFDERVMREEPDVPLGASPSPHDEVGVLVDPESGLEPDLTAEAVAFEISGVGGGDLDPNDIATGDSTVRDVAQERGGAMAAEEAAMHVADDPPMGDGDGYVDEDA